MLMLVMSVMVPVMVPMIVCENQKLLVWHGAQVIEVQAGIIFYGRLDDLQVCW